MLTHIYKTNCKASAVRVQTINIDYMGNGYSIIFYIIEVVNFFCLKELLKLSQMLILSKLLEGLIGS